MDFNKYELFVKKKISITVRQFQKQLNLSDIKLQEILELFRKGECVFVSTNNLLVWSYCSPELKKSLLRKKK